MFVTAAVARVQRVAQQDMIHSASTTFQKRKLTTPRTIFMALKVY